VVVVPNDDGKKVRKGVHDSENVFPRFDTRKLRETMSAALMFGFKRIQRGKSCSRVIVSLGINTIKPAA